MTFPETMLQFEALEDNCTISLPASQLDSSKYYFSTDNINWQPNTITVNSGTIVGVKGTNYPRGSRFSIDKSVNVYGSIMSLVDGVGEQTEITENYGFQYLFEGTTAPINIKGNLLSATTLAAFCYFFMFQNSRSITSLPEGLFPATTLAKSCYARMFYDCKSLTSIPENLLPATTLAEYCYEFLFYGCDGLTSIPRKLLPAMTLAKNCYDGMFYGCNGLTALPKGLLPAMTLVEGCYRRMFEFCTNLAYVPAGVFVEPTTYAKQCYGSLFQSCRGLKEIAAPFKSWPPEESTIAWVQWISKEGDFYCSTSLPVEYGMSRIPTGWTVKPLFTGKSPEFNTITFKKNLVAPLNKWSLVE